MADIELLTPGCEEEDDRGKRGKRGHRGPVGPTGPTGTAGLTGPTGPTGSSSAAPLTPAFTYVANGTEDPAGFTVDFPSGARGGVPYVAVVQVSNFQNGGLGGFVEANAPPSGYTDASIQVRTATKLAAGDTVAVLIINA